MVRRGAVSVATCLRCGFRAGAPTLALLERAVQEHSCESRAYRGVERRRQRRWRVSFAAHCYGKLGSGKCAITDISTAGMAITATHPYRPGEEVTAAWRFPSDHEPFHVSGVIRRVEQGSIGIEFANLSTADQRRILHFVSHRAEHS